MVFIQPLNLYEILVNELAGNFTIFVLLAIFMILVLAAIFKMGGIITMVSVAVFLLIFFFTEGGQGSIIMGILGAIAVIFAIFVGKSLIFDT